MHFEILDGAQIGLVGALERRHRAAREPKVKFFDPVEKIGIRQHLRDWLDKSIVNRATFGGSVFVVI